MIAALVKRSMMITVISGLLLVSGLVYAQLSIIPAMSQLRQTIDDRRASLIVTQQERSNLETLSKNIENVQAQQAELDKHLWSFQSEEEFFSWWETLATVHHIDIAQPKVAEATPNGKAINRAVTAIMTGEINEILSALDEIQKLHPLVAISQVSVTNGLPGASIITVEAQTLWQ